MLTPTFYIANKTPTEHLRLFGQAKKAAGKMEMVAYNIPQCTGSVLAVDTVCEMARRGWIRYCKESSGDLEVSQEPHPQRKGRRARRSGGRRGSSWIKGCWRGPRASCPSAPTTIPEKYIRLYEAGARGDRKALAEQMPELASHTRDSLALRRLLDLRHQVCDVHSRIRFRPLRISAGTG